ncbi:MAG: M20 family metallopeptidase [Candidatus Njordarchaeia archaeon]
MNNPMKFIDEKGKEIVETLVDLVKAKGVNPPGDTTEAVNVIAKILDTYNIEFEIIEPSPGKKNLIAKVGDGDKKLILNGHIDVVPVGEGWSRDPFKAEIVGDQIFGRGTTDMKGGVVALLYAFLAMRDISKGQIIYTAVADEETGGEHGVKYLTENKFIEGDACIVAEPSGSLLHGRYSIVAGEKGNLWIRIIAKGKASHGSMPMLGDSAIKKLSLAINKLPPVFPEKITPPSDAMDLVEYGKEWMNLVNKDAGQVIDHITANIGVIRGGSKINIVPDHAEMEVDIRIPIGLNKDEALKRIREVIGDEYEIEIIESTNPSYTPSDEEIVKISREAGFKFLNYDPTPISMPATSDARFFRRAGIPTLNFGPGFLELAHTKDEYTLISHVKTFAKIYVEIIEKFFS